MKIHHTLILPYFKTKIKHYLYLKGVLKNMVPQTGIGPVFAR